MKVFVLLVLVLVPGPGPGPGPNAVAVTGAGASRFVVIVGDRPCLLWFFFVSLCAFDLHPFGPVRRRRPGRGTGVEIYHTVRRPIWRGNGVQSRK